ncbi:MAG: hypothetical protein ACI814_000554 [Mariniblastus sp.]
MAIVAMVGVRGLESFVLSRSRISRYEIRDIGFDNKKHQSTTCIDMFFPKRQPRAARQSACQHRLTSRDNQSRGGVAAVEAAICFPLIIILMLGTLEITSGLYLKESLVVCAFEGARAGIHRRSTAQDVLDRVQEMLNDRQVDIPSGDPALGVTVTPSDFSGLGELDPITVKITAPTAGNSIFIFDSMANRNVSASVTMVREFDD